MSEPAADNCPTDKPIDTNSENRSRRMQECVRTAERCKGRKFVFGRKGVALSSQRASAG